MSSDQDITPRRQADKEHKGRTAAGAGTAGQSVAVVGRAEVISPFKAAGLAVFPVEPGAGAAARVQELLDAGYGIVFYTEDIEESLAGIIRQCSRQALPCLTLLPMAAKGKGLERLREIVKRAVGADVFATAR